MVGYPQTNRKIDTGKTLTRWPVFVDHFTIATLTAAIASGMGVAVLPESAARSLCGAVNGWMSRITTPSMSLSLSLNLPARANLSPQAQAVKELLMSVISSPVMEKRQWQLVS